MKCEHCRKEMSVVGLEMLNENTECVQTFACTNPRCANYSGRDLNNPLHSVRGELIRV
jgi:hypothetical protein